MKKDISKLLLFDVNVLVALAWPTHQFHAAARRRLDGSAERWATCALTQLSFIRLSSTPAVVGAEKSPAEAARLLAMMVSDSLHVYLDVMPAAVSGDWVDTFDRLLKGKQVTDAYLLFLARKNDATLLTFDTRLPHSINGARTEVLTL